MDELDGISRGTGGLQETREHRAGPADPGQAVQVDRLPAAQPQEEVIEKNRQRARIRGPSEVRDLEAQDLERRSLVGCRQLRGYLVVGEQAGDRGDTVVGQRGDALSEWTRRPRAADEAAFPGQRRVSDRDQARWAR